MGGFHSNAHNSSKNHRSRKDSGTPCITLTSRFGNLKGGPGTVVVHNRLHLLKAPTMIRVVICFGYVPHFQSLILTSKSPTLPAHDRILCLCICSACEGGFQPISCTFVRKKTRVSSNKKIQKNTKKYKKIQKNKSSFLHIYVPLFAYKARICCKDQEINRGKLIFAQSGRKQSPESPKKERSRGKTEGTRVISVRG
eukprot:sb/3470814/